MRSLRFRIFIALLTFTVGISLVYLARTRPAPLVTTLGFAPPIIKLHPSAQTTVEVPPPVAVATPEVTPQAVEITRPHVVSVSPDEIKRYIDEHQREDSGASLQHFWDALSIRHDSWLSVGSSQAKIFKLELDGRTGREVMLRLYDPSGWSWDARYLIFKPINPKRNLWEFVGHIDLECQRYGMPEHSLLVAGKKRWLVIRGLTGSGSGHSSYADSLYELDQSGVKEVFSFPSACYWAESWSGVAQGYDSRILQVASQNDVITVKIQYHRFYEEYDGNKKIPLWSQNEIVSFRQEAGSDELIFEARASDISEKEFDTRYTSDALSANYVLKYNYGRLARIATHGNAKQKKWLRNYLNTCDESPERQSLLKALGGSQP